MKEQQAQSLIPKGDASTGDNATGYRSYRSICRGGIGTPHGSSASIADLELSVPDEYPEDESAPIRSDFRLGMVEKFQAARGGFDDFKGFDKGDNAVLLCIFFLFCYFGLGTFGFSYLFERWSIIDSMYFTVVTFTTW